MRIEVILGKPMRRMPPMGRDSCRPPTPEEVIGIDLDKVMAAQAMERAIKLLAHENAGIFVFSDIEADDAIQFYRVVCHVKYSMQQSERMAHLPFTDETEREVLARINRVAAIVKKKTERLWNLWTDDSAQGQGKMIEGDYKVGKAIEYLLEARPHKLDAWVDTIHQRLGEFL